MSNLVPAEIIASKIFLIRGQKDRELVTNCDQLTLLRHPVFQISGGCHGV